MIQIKKHQMAAFERLAALDFEARTARRLREHFHAALASVSEDELRRLIRLGIERAAAYDIRSDYNVSLYIGAMVHLGRDFDRDGNCPFSTEILRNAYVDATTKMAYIYACTSGEG
ncbi:hypothetical protein [Polyangium spumosum]|uniref:Uncharacterized protein n=1 Tax=Polyangium spumosum TaxID=889282 RepID=A0A6N7PX30_9BACT|nr:hypothetical protein [Polyangium spumosum]MRG94644.1 hypothetical protein [Polyangium spumosum]